MTGSRTLSEAFTPPEGYLGQDGVMCALSATEQFLDECLTAFTGKTSRRRGEEPDPYLFLMLDRASPVPDGRKALGMHLLPWKEHPLWEKVVVMHAKVALLRFGRSRCGPGELLRLVVSTANWTEASAKRQLELVWSLDLDLSLRGDPFRVQGASDLAAAGQFFTALLQMYHQQPYQERIDLLLQSVPPAGRNAQAVPRFISTVGRKPLNLFDQFVSRIPEGRRNYLVCGSGFFEQPNGRAAEPVLLGTLLKRLIDGKRFAGTQQENRILVVNPDQCGQVAEWLRDTDEDECDWRVLKAVDPSGEGRSLHAKFIFLARRRIDTLTNGFLYLGSGNLSRNGFLSAPSSTVKGNIEAGVCFATNAVTSADDDEISCVLPWGEELDFSEFPEAQPVPEDAVGATVLPSSPIACFRALGNGSHRIEWLAERPCAVAEGGHLIPVTAGQATLLLPATLQQATHIVVRGGGSEWYVPVLDLQGRIPAKQLGVLAWEELLQQLESFDSPPSEEEDPPDEEQPEYTPPEDDPIEDGPPFKRHAKGYRRTTEFSRNFPAHSAMILVERISAKSQQVHPVRTSDWVGYLCRYFSQSLPEELRLSWCKLGVNFLSVLKRRHFAPPGLIGEEARNWAAGVDELSSILGVDRYPEIETGVGDEC